VLALRCLRERLTELLEIDAFKRHLDQQHTEPS